MKTYLEISISANDQLREILIPTMINLGCERFQETEMELLCYLDKSGWTSDQYFDFQNKVKNILQPTSSKNILKFREIVEENWNEQWEKSILPIEIGEKIVIKPSWSEYNNINNRIVIQIDPKMSFGTGYHESTRLTLRLLEKYVALGCSILDVGTGTGVLAIAGVKLGAHSAVGIDLDEWSIENARENINANQLSDRIDASQKELHEFNDSSYNLLTANLTLNTNIELLHEFRRILKLNGILILSGLLHIDEDTMEKELKEKKFLIIETLSENEWIAIAAKKT